MSELTLVAVTHQHAPFAVLERVALDADAAGTLAVALRALPGVDEAIVLSTCNRTELYLATEADAEVARRAVETLAAHAGLAAADISDAALVLHGDDASLHLFRVAAGLESRVIGEGEILVQIRATAARAGHHEAAGPAVGALFRWAAATGRRARRHAGGAAAPSLARTALDAVGDIAPDDLTIVLGAGAMAAAVTAELQARRLPYRVAARRPDRAALLTRHRRDAIALDALVDHLPAAAVVICATGARAPIVSRDVVDEARRTSDGRPLTILDLSMPRNVEPSAGALSGVRLVELEHLSGGAGDLHLRRATDVVTAEHHRYRLWLAGRAAGPIIAALRRRVTEICLQEAGRSLDPAAAATFAHRVAGKVLHGPTLAVKELSERGDTAALDALAAALGVDAARSPARVAS